MPANDPKMVEFHRVGFEKVKAAWPEVKAAADAANAPGRFVAFNAFEWHSSRFGDYHFLYPDAGEDIFDGGRIADAHAFARGRGMVMIPHHVGYRAGWRGANWKTFRRDVSPVVDVFSEHGCGMEAEFNMPMLGHSMGGVEKSQTAIEQLRAGLGTGVIASTDNHFGHPASYGEGLAGFWAEELTRASIFNAVTRRHTYAMTGDRIRAMLRSGDAIMGDAVPADAPRTLAWEVDALGAVDFVRIVRNGEVVHDAPLPTSRPSDDDAFVVRLDFGWDAMTSDAVTDWRVRVELDDGRMTEVAPCFAGGAGSVEKLNRVTETTGSAVALEAFTSRRNARPTSGVALRLAGDAATRIRVHAEADWRGESCGCDLSATVEELLTADVWGAISEIFSAPKIRLGQAHGASETRIAGGWTDPSPGEADWYLLKVQQKNGHAAWTSPIFFGNR